jgi:5-methylcytosine-specific restriction protein A
MVELLQQLNELNNVPLGAPGDLGKGVAECRHNKPVSELKPGQKTKLSDLSILCANCHRMIHRARPWKSVKILKNILCLK